jgi:hypothetical protein
MCGWDSIGSTCRPLDATCFPKDLSVKSSIEIFSKKTCRAADRAGGRGCGVSSILEIISPGVDSNQLWE